MIYHLRQFPVHVALLEATGGLEQEVALALHKAGWRVNMANPRKAAHFIRSQENAKTNNGDAKMLARYARNLVEDSARPVNYFMLPDPKRVELEALIKRRSELIGMQVAEQSRLSGAHKRIQGEIQRNITSLNKRITKLELIIEKASNHFREIFDKICIIRDIGKSTVAVLISMMQELRKTNGKRIASLAGLAPHACDSGKLKGQRFCWGGRTEVQLALYMAVLTAVRYEPAFWEFYQQLLSRGKAKKVALVACMRKLLMCINTLLREKVDWDPRRYLSVKECQSAA
jgi:transposase